MQSPTAPPIALTLPRAVAPARVRTPKKNIPQTVFDRNRILHLVRAYVAEFTPVPPVPLDELRVHTQKFMEMHRIEPVYRDYCGVLLNNELWRESLAAVPYERRLLLLPKCLRVESKCPAPFDEFGLLCKQCGLCSIQDLQLEAERLGYAVLVAEGSAIVMSLIQTGKIEAIVGVSCISVLERAFPYMEAAAIPGVAVPLLQDDCIDTTVDLDWVWEYIHLTSDDHSRRMDLSALREELDFWFSPLSLDAIMGAADGETEKVAREWLMRAGKRWRPFLTVSTSQALQGTIGSMATPSLKAAAVAVECFHKASLIHDDIEDGDEVRYGEKTLHAEYGVPFALNVGDLLIGEGYRLLASCGVSADQARAMMKVAAEGQRELCLGQGAELAWARAPRPMSSMEVLDIFRRKTAPAFSVALKVGAIFAGMELAEDVEEVLTKYSEALGIAYQIRDDLDDLGPGAESNDIIGRRPSLLLATAHERATGEAKERLARCWNRTSDEPAAAIEALYAETNAIERCQDLLERYKEEAVRSLLPLEHASLKGLMRRVIAKIFNETEIKGWCKEFEQKEPADGEGEGAASPAASETAQQPSPDRIPLSPAEAVA